LQTDTPCPQCQSLNTYLDGILWTCPECAHEWSSTSDPTNLTSEIEEDDQLIRDANGSILTNGDSVTVIKELRIKGASSVVKVGTKVKNIHLTDGGDGHNIACKIDGLGAINLKSEFVRKS
jgi:protein PhnA